MSSSAQYEFSPEQNTLVGSLASKMRVVGAFSVAFGVVGLLITVLVIVAIYRDRLPAGWADKIKEYQQAAREKLPEDAKTQVDQYTPDKLPANNHLWGIALYAGYLHARGLKQWRGKRAAGILVLGYAGVMFTYFAVNLWVSGLHSYAGV